MCLGLSRAKIHPRRRQGGVGGCSRLRSERGVNIDTPWGLPHHAPAMNAPEPRPEDPAPPLEEGTASTPTPTPTPAPEPAPTPTPTPTPENVVAEVASDVRAAIAPVGSAMKAD